MFLYSLQSSLTFTLSNDSQENIIRYYLYIIDRKTASGIKLFKSDHQKGKRASHPDFLVHVKKKV